MHSAWEQLLKYKSCQDWPVANTCNLFLSVTVARTIVSYTVINLYLAELRTTRTGFPSLQQLTQQFPVEQRPYRETAVLYQVCDMSSRDHKLKIKLKTLNSAGQEAWLTNDSSL